MRKKEQKTRLTKAQRTIIRVETAAAVAMFMIAMVLIKAIIDGSLWAFLGATIPALAISLLLDESVRAQRRLTWRASDGQEPEE